MMPEGAQPAAGLADDLARRSPGQLSELARDQKIGQRMLRGQRVWFLVLMPLGLLGTAFARHVQPLWPYPAAIWASGPAVAWLALWICRRPSRQPWGRMPGLLGRRMKLRVPMVLYTSQAIADVTSVVSVLLLILSGVTIGAYSGSPAGSVQAQHAAQAWHCLFGVLPALVLSVVVRVNAARGRRRGNAGAA